MSLFLAIDAGGTKADLALADEHRMLARVRTGTIKRMRTDAETATANLEAALRELTATTGADLGSVTRTCIGTAGNQVPLVVDWLREALGQRVGGELLLLSDVEIALDAAFPRQGGVLVLAGTGSNVIGRTRRGALSTVGGWGPALADQGSGHRIGLQALRASFLALDEGRPTILLEGLLSFWGLASVEEMIAYANSSPAPDVSKLTGVVVECARAQDEVATDVLKAQGEELAYLVLLMMRRLRAAEPGTAWTPPVAFAGSILEKVTTVREGLLDRVRREFPRVQALEGVVDPVEGALARARQG